MYHFSTVSDSLGGVSSFYHTVNDNALCVVIETNDYEIRSYNQKLGFHELFAEAFHLINIDTPIENIPLVFAKKIDSILRESNKNYKDGTSSHANFTGVALTKNQVHICTAGICRVHLIKNKQILKVTKDHNFANDLFDKSDLNFDLSLEKNSMSFLVSTRILGFEGSENKPPESVSWEVGGDYTILICTKQYHKFRNPTDYITSFIKSNPLEITTAENVNEGFLGIIKRVNEDI